MKIKHSLNSLLLGTLLSVCLAPHALAGAGEHGHHHHKEVDNHASGHHGKEHHSIGHHDAGHHGKSLAGEPGKAAEIDRVIDVDAGDDMRFKMEELNIRPGETIKFNVTNTGKLKHEFSVGTQKEHKTHGEMMEKNPNMHHGPGGASITLEPGATASLIWKFNKAKKIQLACNFPGHYQAGMFKDVDFK